MNMLPTLSRMSQFHSSITTSFLILLVSESAVATQDNADMLVGSYCPLLSSAFTANNTIFPARSTNREAKTLACKQQYNATFLTVEEMETRYHFARADLENSTHIIWSKGEYDPTSATEPSELPLVPNRHASRTLYAPNVAHREDLFRSHPNDRESTKALRKQELEIIKSWLSDKP
jgi:hypothetical protein